jgi:hypothetical protein
MEKLKTYEDFAGNGSGQVQGVFDSVVTAVPLFFPILMLLLFIGGTLIAYFAILKTTGRKRFWESATAMSFLTFILSGVVYMMNRNELTYLSAYWVIFYLVLTVILFLVMNNYK